MSKDPKRVKRNVMPSFEEKYTLILYSLLHETLGGKNVVELFTDVISTAAVLKWQVEEVGLK